MARCRLRGFPSPSSTTHSVWRLLSDHRLLRLATDFCRRSFSLGCCGRHTPAGATSEWARPETRGRFCLRRTQYSATMASSALSSIQRYAGPLIAHEKIRPRMPPVSTTNKAAKTNKATSTTAILIMVAMVAHQRGYASMGSIRALSTRADRSVATPRRMMAATIHGRSQREEIQRMRRRRLHPGSRMPKRA